MSDYQVDDTFGDDFQPSYLQVGENFQQLPIIPAVNFPSNGYLTSGNYVKVADLTGKELRHVCRASMDQDDLPYREVVYFDKTKIVGCDGNRIHVVDKTTPISLRVMTYVIKKLCNEKNIELWNDGGNIKLSANGLTVFTEDQSIWFPDVDQNINSQFNCCVTLDSPTLEKIMNQALIMTGKSYRAVDMTFENSNLSVSINSTRGKFIKEDVRFAYKNAIVPETFKVDAALIRDALRARAGILNEVEIHFGGNPKYLKLIQGGFTSLILTMK